MLSLSRRCHGWGHLHRVWVARQSHRLHTSLAACCRRWCRGAARLQVSVTDRVSSTLHGRFRQGDRFDGHTGGDPKLTGVKCACTPLRLRAVVTPRGRCSDALRIACAAAVYDTDSQGPKKTLANSVFSSPIAYTSAFESKAERFKKPYEVNDLVYSVDSGARLPLRFAAFRPAAASVRVTTRHCGVRCGGRQQGGAYDRAAAVWHSVLIDALGGAPLSATHVAGHEPPRAGLRGPVDGPASVCARASLRPCVGVTPLHVRAPCRRSCSVVSSSCAARRCLTALQTLQRRHCVCALRPL
jgi:hypothetical protein